jgi:hypothetical protein
MQTESEVGRKGLLRAKMYLKRHDQDLAYRLLDIANQMMHTEDIDQVDILDASVKMAIRMDPIKKTLLQIGLLKWMDEIICEYLGMTEDEDEDLSMEGSMWLSTGDAQASAWFDEIEHMRSYIQFVLQHLVSQEDRPNDLYPILSRMAGHLKIANERIFETETNELDKDKIDYIQSGIWLRLSTIDLDPVL